jgi:hypothetical protein
MDDLDERLIKKVRSFVLGLTSWARREKLLKSGERLEVRISVKSLGPTPDLSTISVADFFNKDTLRQCGASGALATRIHNALLSDLDLEEGEYSPPMTEWLDTYVSQAMILGIPQMGRKGVAVVVALLAEIGIKLDER